MLLTESRAADVDIKMPARRGRAGVFLSVASVGVFGAVAHLDLLLLRVGLRGSADHRLDDAVVGVVDVRRDVPLLAVPRMDARLGLASVVHAARADGRHEAGKAELLDRALVDREVL